MAPLKPAPVVLAIGGLDPTGHAGLAADLRAGAALDSLVAPVAAALTVQDQDGVRRVQAVDKDLLAEQIAAALRSLPVGAVKIGLLPGVEQLRCVAEALKGFDGPWVLDPVLSATRGGALAGTGLPEALRELAPRVTLLTPNLGEAAALLGAGPVRDAEGMEASARALKALGFGAVLVKGGHLDGPRVPDYLLDGDSGLWIDGERVETANTRGTGCTLATLVAVLLAKGQPLRLACIGAKKALAILLNRGAQRSWPLGPGPIL